MPNRRLAWLCGALLLSSPVFAQLASFPVYPYAETAPLGTSSPTIGVPAVWLHPTTLTQSLLLTVDGSTSLDAHDISGNGAALSSVAGSFTDVDVTYQFPLAGTQQALVAVRSLDNTVRFFTVNPSTRALTEVSASPSLTLPTGTGCLRLARPADAPGTFELWTTSGLEVSRWRLRSDAGTNQVTADLLASASILQGSAAGCAADEDYGLLYVSQAALGLARTQLLLDGGAGLGYVATVGTGVLSSSSSVGAVGLYRGGGGKGEVILGTEGATGNGSTVFLLFDRQTNEYVSSFTIADSGVADAVNNSAGLAVANLPLDARAPQGTLIAHDAQQGGTDHPNFKLVSWGALASAANAFDAGAILVDTSFDPRGLATVTDGGLPAPDAGPSGSHGSGGNGPVGPGISPDTSSPHCGCSALDAPSATFLLVVLLGRALLRRRDSVDFDS